MQILLLIYIVMFRIVITRHFLNYINLINIIFFGILSLWAYFTLGFQKRNDLKDYNANQTIIISYIVYYILIYLFGLFFGFLSNFYSLKIVNIVKNIVIVAVFYGFREMYRYMAVKSLKNKKKFNIVLITLLLTILDIVMEINVDSFASVTSIFEFIEVSVIPNVALNLVLSYIAYNFSYRTLLLFLLCLKLPNYFMPIFPNLGNYLETIIKIIFFFYCYYQLSYIMEKWEQKDKNNKINGKKLSLFLIAIPVLVLVGLVSGLFKYHLFAIASNSMVPIFSRGDAVLIEKIRNDELENLKVDDIIAFYHDKKVIVHRIVSINKNGDKYLIRTKGDNNASVDAWTINSDMIYGKVIYVVNYIGIPSVELSELVNK